MENKQIKLGAVLSYTAIFLNILSGLLYTPWMIEQIGRGDYGLYTLANSLITLFTVDFGLSSAVTRYLSTYRAEGRQDKIDNFLGAVYKLYLIIDAVIFTVLAVVYFCTEKIYVNLTPAELERFKVVYIVAALFAVVNFPFVTFNGILNAYEKFIPLKLADVIYRILLVGVTITALLLGQGLYALVAVHAIVGLLIIVYKFIVIRKVTPVKVNWKFRDKSLYKEILGFSVWVMISLLAQRLVFNITPSILAVVANSAAIAVFGVVATIEGYSYTIITAISGMFMPKISRIYEQGNGQQAIMPLMIKVGRIQYAINGLIVVGFFLIGKCFISLWMDSSYADAYYGILLVIVPGLFYNSLEVANTAMVVQKKVKVQAIITIATGVTNAVLSFGLSYFYGVIGACLSIFAAYILRAVLLFVFCQYKMQFDMKKFAAKCYLRMSASMVMTIAAGMVLNWLLADGGWLVLIAKGAVICLVYVLAVWLLGIDKEEKTAVLRCFKKRG